MNQPNNFNFNPNNYGAYNPNYGYTPYMYGQMAQNKTLQGGNTFSYVNGLEGAKGFAMPPNQTILLMDSDNPMFYLKTSNNLGQAFIKAYKFEEVNLDAPTLPQTTKIDYVTKKDLDDLKAYIENGYVKKAQKKESD